MMRTLLLISVVFMFSSSCGKKQGNIHYITNQFPLVEQTYSALPLGAIKPEGMLRKILEIQRDGLTGHLDSIYEVVCGDNNGWLGGMGDGWERGPYWLDGLVPMAYLLDDEELKAKAQKWIEWSIENQREDGYFGPVPLPEGYEKIQGTQQGMREDWWPKMVMLKVLQQYYSATNDKRILKLMTNYFKYQLETLPDKELGYYTFWANRRGGDNLQIVYWLYNITGDKFLLELGELLHEQTYNWTELFSNNSLRMANPYVKVHCVNLAQGLKEPVIYYQQSKDKKYLDAVKEGLTAIHDTHGFVTGMYGGDEALHGNNPTQGSEFCSAVELMYSFESILPITGDVYYADYLEKVAYNVLPTQHSDDFTRKQYYQQVNQVLLTNEYRNFDTDHKSDLVYGVTTGYPCCLTNMHQGWPKFIQNLWYATADNGLAALVYGPSSVKAKVADGAEVEFVEETGYPFKEGIRITYKTEESVYFPLHLRIPGWCTNAEIKINGSEAGVNVEGKIAVIEREWKKGDVVELYLPMELRFSRWYERSLGIERGPLVYAFGIEGKWKKKMSKEYKHSFYEVFPKSPWNYGIRGRAINNPEEFKVEVSTEISDMPWNVANAPVKITATGHRIPFWKMYQGSAGSVPYSPVSLRKIKTPEEKITLIPYGCTTLRIAQFPVINK